jgi:hypothetical protein
VAVADQPYILHQVRLENALSNERLLLLWLVVWLLLWLKDYKRWTGKEQREVSFYHAGDAGMRLRAAQHHVRVGVSRRASHD